MLWSCRLSLFIKFEGLKLKLKLNLFDEVQSFKFESLVCLNGGPNKNSQKKINLFLIYLYLKFSINRSQIL